MKKNFKLPLDFELSNIDADLVRLKEQQAMTTAGTQDYADLEQQINAKLIQKNRNNQRRDLLINDILANSQGASNFAKARVSHKFRKYRININRCWLLCQQERERDKLLEGQAEHIRNIIDAQQMKLKTDVQHLEIQQMKKQGEIKQLNEKIELTESQKKRSEQ